MNPRSDCLVVIPARFGSTRFPGKVLALLGGRPVVQWCWQAGLGQYDIDKIDIRGEKIADVKRPYRLHPDIERELRWIGPLEDVEKPL